MRKVVLRGVLLMAGTIGAMVLLGDAARASPRLLRPFGPRTTIIVSGRAPSPYLAPAPFLYAPQPAVLAPTPFYAPAPAFAAPPIYAPAYAPATGAVVASGPVGSKLIAAGGPAGGAVIAKASVVGPKVIAAGSPLGGAAIVGTPFHDVIVATPVPYWGVPYYAPWYTPVASGLIVSHRFGPDLVAGPGGFIYHGPLGGTVVVGRAGVIVQGPLGGGFIAGPAGVIVTHPFGWGSVIAGPWWWV